MAELFFDTETTGMVAWKEGYESEKQPGIVQFGAILSDGPDRVLQEVNLLIDCRMAVDEGAAAVHGISAEECSTFGIREEVVGHLVYGLFGLVDIAIAHNVAFDKVVVCSHLNRVFGREYAEEVWKRDFYCTMTTTTDLVKLPGKFGKYKWPKLVELHEFLFGEGFEGAHDALADVRALRRCYFELVARGEVER